MTDSINNFKIRKEDFKLDFNEDKYFIGQLNLMTPKKILIQGHSKKTENINEKENISSPKLFRKSLSSPISNLSPPTPLSPKTNIILNSNNIINNDNGKDGVFSIPDPITPKRIKSQASTPSKLKAPERSSSIFTTPIKYNLSSSQLISYSPTNEIIPMDLSPNKTVNKSTSGVVYKKAATSTTASTKTISPPNNISTLKKPSNPVIVSPTLNNKRVQDLKKMDEKSVKNEIHPTRLSQISRKSITPKSSTSTVTKPTTTTTITKSTIGVKRASITPILSSTKSTIVNKPTTTATTTTTASKALTPNKRSLTSTTTPPISNNTATIDSNKKIKMARLSVQPTTTKPTSIPTTTTTTTTISNAPMVSKPKRYSMINPSTSTSSINRNPNRKSIIPSNVDDDFEKRIQEAMEAEEKGLKFGGSLLLTSPEKEQLESKRSKWSPIKKTRTSDLDDIYVCTKKY